MSDEQTSQDTPLPDVLQYHLIIEMGKSSLYAGENSGGTGKLEEALSIFSKAMNLFPFQEPYYLRGLTYLKLKKWVEAINDFTEALSRPYVEPVIATGFQHISKKECEIECLLSRGICFGTIDKFEEALTDLNRVLELDEKNSTAYKFKGLLFYDTRNQNPDPAFQIQESLSMLIKAQALGDEEASEHIQDIMNKHLKQ